ncbi:MAG: N-methyl-L-tryptophan oxidase [Ktedonobacteraceae bacterium]
MRQQQVIIVGGGIIGLSTAYALLTLGVKQVAVLEQEAVNHQRSSSHGTSRLLRFEYGADIFYSNMVRLSLSRWQQLESITKRTLYTRTGLLVLGTESDEFTQSSYRVLQELNIPTERLTKQYCKQRFPQFAAQANDAITYNTEAGILHASTCLQTLRDLIIDLGGTISESCRVTHITNDGTLRPVRLCTSTGDELTADRVVLATGAWVHGLLADLHLPVRLTRQYLLYFAGLPSALFSVNAFPAFITSDDFYGFPMHYSASSKYGPNWLKAASHTFGTQIDPDDILPAEKQEVERAARRLKALLPALEEAELVQVDSCMYDVTPDEDFILDALPYDSRIVFATGLSGHAFKFGLLLGELLSSMVCNIPPSVALDRFQLARFSRRHQEAFVA